MSDGGIRLCEHVTERDLTVLAGVVIGVRCTNSRNFVIVSRHQTTRRGSEQSGDDSSIGIAVSIAGREVKRLSGSGFLAGHDEAVE